MNFGIGKRHLSITIERNPIEIPEEKAMIGASDRELEQIVRRASQARDPRWEIGPALFGGYHV